MAKILDTKQQNGFCIRCKKPIKFDLLLPYCKKCYIIWNKYANKEYKEKYCHICGRSSKSTLNKPVCHPCYKKNKKLFN